MLVGRHAIAPQAADDAGKGNGGTAPEGGAGGDGGTGAGAVNAQCAPGSVAEIEPNDTAATANAIPNASGSFCGSLGTATDVDFVTFVLPADAKSLGFGSAYSQQGLVIEGTAAGQTFAVGQTPAFKPGQAYVLKVRTIGTAPVSYRLDVSIGK